MVRLVHFTDTHVGHRDVPTKLTLGSLLDALRKLPKPETINYLVCTGDFFDSGLAMPEADVLVIQIWTYDLAKWLVTNNITMLLLEGTATHDNNQSGLIALTLNNAGAECHYFDAITYKSFPDLDLIAIPDSLPGGYKVSQEVARLEMQNANVESVTLALTHGMYDYQISKSLHDKIDTFDSGFFEGVVSKVVLNGHNHTGSTNGIITNTGSWGRYRHGEESAKGLMDITIDSEVTMTFVENDKAQLFHTYTLLSSVEYDATTELIEYLEKYKDVMAGNIRVMFPHGMAILTVLSKVEEAYPTLFFKPERITEDKVETLVESKKRLVSAIPINASTIIELTRSKLIEVGTEDLEGTINTLMEIKDAK